MRTAAATAPGSPDSPNEDWYYVSPYLQVVLDGATVRTGTGCVHGVAWYVDRLGSALVKLTEDSDRSLVEALAGAIEQVNSEHPECDLGHEGTPSAAAAVTRQIGQVLEYLVLGDVAVVLDTGTGLEVVVDRRIGQSAQPYRAQAKALPIGDPARAQALVAMKRAELAARNTPDGYWISASNPEAAQHALTGVVSLDQLHRLALATDGAARAVVMFDLVDWAGLLDVLQDQGPEEVIRLVREAENGDPEAVRWRRNKKSDDATAVLATPEVAQL